MSVAGVYLVTSDPAPGRSILEVIEAAVDAGVETVQLRAKHASARDFLAVVEATAAVIRDRALLIVNDRVDIVLAARESGIRVDGAHLGQSDLPPTVARRLLGRHSVLGLTANTREHLDDLAAHHHGVVDHLGVGAVHPTTTKADHPPALGVAGFASFAAGAPLSCVAIGGITAADVAPLRRAGASAVAVASSICAAADPGRAAVDLVAAWNAAGARS